MVTSADAALRWLGRPTPDLDEVKAALEQIRKSGQHASHIIGSVRAMIRKDARNRAPVDVNELVREALALLEGELQRHRISVETALNEHLPTVNADRVQLQQVLMNLTTNAIDAMIATKPPRILRNISRPMSLGALAPGTRTAPMSKSTAGRSSIKCASLE